MTSYNKIIGAIKTFDLSFNHNIFEKATGLNKTLRTSHIDIPASLWKPKEILAKLLCPSFKHKSKTSSFRLNSIESILGMLLKFGERSYLDSSFTNILIIVTIIVNFIAVLFRFLFDKEK